MTLTKLPVKLPRGIWYEETRERYRVRIYQNKRVFHLSYHRTLNEALNIYHRIKELPDHPVGDLDTMLEQSHIYYKGTRVAKP
jgi:hypothetical protein